MLDAKVPLDQLNNFRKQASLSYEIHAQLDQALSWHLMEEYVETRLLTVEKIAGSVRQVCLVRNPMPAPNSMLTIWEFFSEHADQLSALLQHYTAEIQELERPFSTGGTSGACRTPARA